MNAESSRLGAIPEIILFVPHGYNGATNASRIAARVAGKWYFVTLQDYKIGQVLYPANLYDRQHVIRPLLEADIE